MKDIQIRWCTQCEDVLPRRCVRCVRHPDRKPRIVQVFGLPEVLAEHECGCRRIRCQRPGCPKTRWVQPKADGTLKETNHFCSPGCVRIVTAAARRAQRVSSPCSCGCGRTVTRPQSNMKARRAYFSQKCHFVHRAVMKAEARRATANGDDSVQSLACYGPRCRGAVTDHAKQPHGSYACVRCNVRRPLPSTREAAAA